MADGASERQWYSVRCVFRVINEDGPGDDGGFDYEERLTLWMASSDAQAIAFAEAEAAEYSSEGIFEYLGIAQSFWLFEPPEDGKEVFSLIRTSDLEPRAYLDQFFDTGRENQRPN
jgi:hypothetical protein